MRAMTSRNAPLRLVPLVLCIALACLATLILASCTYLLDDPYPAYTQRISTWTDIDATVKQVSGGASLLFINHLDYLESGSSSGIFLQLATSDGVGRLVTLDGGDFGSPVSYVYGIDPVGLTTGLSSAGQYRSGAVLMNPANRTSAAVLGPISGILLSEAGVNYYGTVSGATMSAARYDSAWVSLGTVSVQISTIYPGPWELVSAGQGGGWYSFLFRDSSSNSYRAFRTPSLASMTWTSLFDDPAVPASYRTPQFSADMSSVGITADGPVMRGHSQGGNGDKLSFLPFGSSSSKDYYPRNSGSVQYFFEASGQYWFLHEASSGRLYKLRTWWK